MTDFGGHSLMIIFLGCQTSSLASNSEMSEDVLLAEDLLQAAFPHDIVNSVNFTSNAASFENP